MRLWLLFIIVLKGLSCIFCQGCPWELLYADDLVICAESIKELIERFTIRKDELAMKGLRVNMNKTEVMVCGHNLNPLQDSGCYPCGVCRKGVGRNSIYYQGCQHWVHKKCSGITRRIKADPHYRCRRCQGSARPTVGRLIDKVITQNQELEVV